MYVVYTFLLAIAWFFLSQKSLKGSLISGFWVGVTVSLRLPFLLFFIPFAIQKKYSFLLGGLLGAVSSVALSWAIAGTFIWKRYALTVSQMTGLVDLETHLTSLERSLPDANIIYPKIVEGFDWNIRNPLERYIANSSLYHPLNILRVPNERGILLVGFIFMMLLLLQLLKYLPKERNLNYLFLFGILTCLLGEFFLPIPRYPYYDIQMLLPLFVVIGEADAEYLVGRKINIILALGLLLSTIGFIVVPKALMFAAWLIALYVAAIAISISLRNRNSSH